eukprot:gnl/Carplike_NY0171/10373_a14615_133.p1 GENE.gnl/Carplike_NY0171/10373_a14615_133~~gnl/Carplike_NY0171/10373_a14615_133.p1  ORF type:complete len:240 (-),score=43.15 gnl/Carplike_NY0171/10373_a14615_133:99-818(-)
MEVVKEIDEAESAIEDLTKKKESRISKKKIKSLLRPKKKSSFTIPRVTPSNHYDSQSTLSLSSSSSATSTLSSTSSTSSSSDIFKSVSRTGEVLIPNLKLSANLVHSESMMMGNNLAKQALIERRKILRKSKQNKKVSKRSVSAMDAFRPGLRSRKGENPHEMPIITVDYDDDRGSSRKGKIRKIADILLPDISKAMEIVHKYDPEQLPSSRKEKELRRLSTLTDLSESAESQKYPKFP